MLRLLVVYCIVIIMFAIIHKIAKNKKPIRKSLLSILIGFSSLVLVNITGYFTGVYIPYSILSVMVSTIGGVPGVTALLALNLFI